MEREYSEGQIIIREGGWDKTIYVLKSGKLGVMKGKRLIAEIQTPGTPFGEIGVILNQPRNATVKALTHCVVEEYPNGISEMAEDQPQAVELIMGTVARRLSDTTDKLYSYMIERNEHSSSTTNPYVISFRNVTAIEDQVIQRVISISNNNDLIAALLGAIPRARHKFFKNMSRRKANIVKEDMRAAVGVYNKKAVEVAQERILQIINEVINVESMKRGI